MGTAPAAATEGPAASSRDSGEGAGKAGEKEPACLSVLSPTDEQWLEVSRTSFNRKR